MPNARRIIAYGLRNPFRITVRPGTNEVWIGDVGWTTWEEVNRLVDPRPAGGELRLALLRGQGRQSGYDGANLDVCENLYGQAGAVTGPYFTYNHSSKVVAGETCPTGSSSVAGLGFYRGAPTRPPIDGALFFADYSRDCIWAMKADASGLPAPGLLETFVAPAANPVDVQISPAGELFYADFDGGTIRRIQFVSANQPPVAVATANPTSGPAPLTVTFDGSGSSDPDGDPITHAWDLDGDGALRRLHGSAADVHLSQRREPHRAAPGHRQPRRLEPQRPARHHRRQHAAHRDDQCSLRRAAHGGWAT